MAMPLVKSGVKAIGRQVLSSGAQIASDVISEGRDPREVFLDHGKKAVGSLLNNAANKIQSGKGVGKRPKGKSTISALKRRQSNTHSVPRKKSCQTVDSCNLSSEIGFQAILENG